MGQFSEFLERFDAAQVIMPSKKYITAFLEREQYTSDHIPDQFISTNNLSFYYDDANCTKPRANYLAVFEPKSTVILYAPSLAFLRLVERKAQ